MTKAQRQHMERVQALGCIACFVSGMGIRQAEIHHPLLAGRRRGHMHVLPLCPEHHRGGLNDDQFVSRHPYKREFERRYGTEDALLRMVDDLLNGRPLLDLDPLRAA